MNEVFSTAGLASQVLYYACILKTRLDLECSSPVFNRHALSEFWSQLLTFYAFDNLAAQVLVESRTDTIQARSHLQTAQVAQSLYFPNNLLHRWCLHKSLTFLTSALKHCSVTIIITAEFKRIRMMLIPSCSSLLSNNVNCWVAIVSNMYAMQRFAGITERDTIWSQCSE